MSQLSSNLEKEKLDSEYQKAYQLFEHQSYEEAYQILAQILSDFPHYAAAWYLLGRTYQAVGQNAKACEILSRALLEAPQDKHIYTTLADCFVRVERFPVAYKNYVKALELDDEFYPALKGLGVAYLLTNNWEQGEAYLHRCLKLRQDDFEVYNDLGYAAVCQNQREQALTYFKRAIALNETCLDAYNNIASLYSTNGEIELAEEYYYKILSLQSTYPDVYNNLGNIHKERGDYSKAIDLYQRAISQNPNFFQAYNNLGSTYQTLGDTKTAQHYLAKAYQLAPEDININYNLGWSLTCEADYFSADKYFKNVLTQEIDHTNAWLGRLVCAIGVGDIQFLSAVFEEYCHNEMTAELTYQFGVAFYTLSHSEQALHAFTLAETLADYLPATFYKNYIYANRCDWQHMSSNLSLLEEKILTAPEPLPIEPFALFALPISTEVKKIVTQTRARMCLKDVWPCQHTAKPRPQVLKIGYVSPDFSEHAISLLVRDILRFHDRTKFEIFAYSLSSQRTEHTDLIQASVDHFRDLTQDNDYHAAQKIHADGIDILVDLAGYTGQARPEIYAYRPAPIQTHMLGVSTSLHASFIDYFFADSYLVPPEQQALFSEELLYLPHAYATPPYATHLPKVNRADFGLPEDVFVYCCFAKGYRITENLFKTWCDILHQTPRSILWLTGDQYIQTHLKAAARKYGLDPERLYFYDYPDLTSQWPMQCADLWLDPHLISSGTGCLLAIWAGLPLLTCPALTPESRTAATMLRTLPVPDLIATSCKDYIERAVEFYNNPEYLAKLKNTLKQYGRCSALFDGQAYIRSIEQQFSLVADKYFMCEKAKN